MMDSQRLDLLHTPVFDEESDGENSKDGLQIVLNESPKQRVLIEINAEEKNVINSFEDELERQLDAKAEKAHLTVTNVKNILKNVITNAHVVAMVRQSIDDSLQVDDAFIYEPKLTRAKAKELFPSQGNTIPHWITPSPPSEHHILINKELAEDSSGDEYIPDEDEIASEDELSVTTSDADSQPRTPAKLRKLKKIATDCSTQTTWSNDGIFKMPVSKNKTEENAEMIALRTRSKFSLNDTPLEIIEGQFVPPDVTTDMYDVECDDDDWSEFLKKFTRPLDEAVIGAEDEETDPEYNVLADEEIELVDKEELRADKGVKVTRKELNALIAELYEFTDTYTKSHQNSVKTDSVTALPPEFVSLENCEQLPASSLSVADVQDPLHIECELQQETPPSPECIMEPEQILLLEQQLRQHVQLLTQNFLLTFRHPELWKRAIVFKENLMALHRLSDGKTNSIYDVFNLNVAVQLIREWENKADTEEFQQMLDHVTKVVRESKESKSSGRAYVVTFPQLFLETVCDSCVFLYPSLLPKIPFKCTDQKFPCVPSEVELIAIGMEQFIPFLEKDPYHLTTHKKVKSYNLAYMLCQYLLPAREPHQLKHYIRRMKQARSPPNPIKHYYEHRAAPITVHYVVPLEQFGVCSPRYRPKEMLSRQWRNYLYPSASVIPQSPVVFNTINKIVKPPVYNKNVVAKRSPQKRSHSKSPLTVQKRTKSLNTNKKSTAKKKCITSTENFISSSPTSLSFERHSTEKQLDQYFQHSVSPIKNLCTSPLNNFKFNSSVFKGLQNTNNMFPSMPFLNTPMKDTSEPTITYDETIDGSRFELVLSESSTAANSNHESEAEHKEDEAISPNPKDNEQELNALMVASSTIRSGKRPASATERKKAKLKREYNATLTMLSPENVEIMTQKAESFGQAFYDKLQERLEPLEYQEVLKVLHDFSALVDNVTELYRKIEAIIGEKYPDLCEEFLIFLTPSQANELGKYLPHFILTNMSLFLRKLEVFYTDQPAQLKKIYNALTTLANRDDVTMDVVKSTILPLLKGNAVLTDWFLQVFPTERPPSGLLNGTWEQMDYRQLEENDNYDGYEYITIPDVEDPYGGPNCICSCHQVDDEIFKSRSRHCVPCGTKFLQGRVYVQTGKGLRLANVTFDNSLNIQQIARLSVQTTVNRQKRRSETLTSPTKTNAASPHKEGHEEPRMSNESEDDLDCKRTTKVGKVPRSPRKKKAAAKCDKPPDDQTTTSNAAAKQRSNNKALPKFKLKLASVPLKEKSSAAAPDEKSPSALPAHESQTLPEATKSPDLSAEEAPIPSCQKAEASTEDTQEAIECNEWECNTSIESIDLKSSPVAADTESVGDEFLEESSQDNIATESDGSMSDIETENSDQENTDDSGAAAAGNDERGVDYDDSSWTRDEDKVILQTFREEGDTSAAFEKMKESLCSRSVPQLRQRFHVLMSLLRKMACDT